ncbi:MAG: nucleoside recognition domain-containing protein, partial [Dorea sp.]
MLNYLWAAMILIGIVFASFTGKIPDITNAALDSSKEAISLCITMMGVMSFWTGLMEIATKAGIIETISRKMSPLIRFLFPALPPGHPATEHIITNIIANFLGLGWAATPAGLRAMSELAKLEDDRRAGRMPGPVRKSGIASDEMCTFLIINISSL